MVTLTLEEMETAVAAAFERWLDQNPQSFQINIGGHEVVVVIRLTDSRFDCGVPGYNMANQDVDGLGEWVPGHIKRAGRVGGLAPCKNVSGTGQVNVVLGDVKVMFNFHVNLVDKC